MSIYTNTCLTGMGFWLPNTNQAFHCQTPHICNQCDIFFFEALTVLYAIIWVTESSLHVKKLAIFRDSSNTVDIFYSLRAYGV